MKIEMDNRTHDILVGVICMSPIFLGFILALVYLLK